MNSIKKSPGLEIEKKNDLGLQIAKARAFIMVLVGMLNTIPAIPGLEELIHSVTENDRIVFRNFSYEYFCPIMFFLMMLDVSLNDSVWREYGDKGPVVRGFSVFMEISLILMAA